MEIFDLKEGKTIGYCWLNNVPLVRFAFPLPDGRVLLLEDTDVKLYDPKMNTVKTIDRLVVPRYKYTAVKTQDNKIYIFGGGEIERNPLLKVSSSPRLNLIEVFDYNEFKKRGI